MTPPTERLVASPVVAAHDDGSARPAEKSLVEIIKAIKPSVVRIETDEGSGTGFLVGTHGEVVTNAHVIQDASQAVATFHDGHAVVVLGCLMVAKDNDLAVLKLDGSTRRPPPPLKLYAGLPEQGEKVFAYGNPLGLSDTVSDGIVSAVRVFNDHVLIQHTAPISPGNSGGPLLNARGEVVGVNTFYLRDAQNLNFAVSSRDVLALLVSERQAAAVFPRQRPWSVPEGIAARTHIVATGCPVPIEGAVP